MSVIVHLPPSRIHVQTHVYLYMCLFIYLHIICTHAHMHIADEKVSYYGWMFEMAACLRLIGGTISCLKGNKTVQNSSNRAKHQFKEPQAKFPEKTVIKWQVRALLHWSSKLKTRQLMWASRYQSCPWGICQNWRLKYDRLKTWANSEPVTQSWKRHESQQTLLFTEHSAHVFWAQT